MSWGVLASSHGAGGGGGGNPELLPNPLFNDSTNVTLGGGASIVSGVLDLGTSIFNLARETFTRANIQGEVFALNIVLERSGDCGMLATFGYGGGAQYGSQTITASGEYLFTYTDPDATAPWEVMLYNGASGSTSPRIESLSFKKV